MFALDPIPFDPTFAAPSEKVVHSFPHPQMDARPCLPDYSNYPSLTRDQARELERKETSVSYLFQNQVDFSEVETNQFSLSNFPQEDDEAIFDSIPFDVPNLLPRSTAAEISWLRNDRNDRTDFLKDDFECESYMNSSSIVENSFYMSGMENSFRSVPNRHVKCESSQPDRARMRETIDYVSPKVAKAVHVDLEDRDYILPKLCLKVNKRRKSALRRAEASTHYTLKVKKEKSMKCTIPTLDGYRKVDTKHTPGKKPKLKARWTLLCAHCGKIFCARPTPKNSRYVVNHMCPVHGNKRKQFVIGTKARRCEKTHRGPCIQQLIRSNE